MRARHPFLYGAVVLAAMCIPPLLAVVAIRALGLYPVPDWLRNVAAIFLFVGTTVLVLISLARVAKWDGVSAALTFHSYTLFLTFGFIAAIRLFGPSASWRESALWVLIFMIPPAVIWMAVALWRLPPVIETRGDDQEATV